MRILDLSATDIFYTRSAPRFSCSTAGGRPRLVEAIRDVSDGPGL
jgi:hypothetical protein